MMFLDMTITDYCNLNCKHCFLRDKNKNHMSIEMIEDIVRDYMTLDHPVSGRMVLISGGEPTVHPDFPKIIEMFHHNNWQVNLATNGNDIPRLVDEGVIRPGDNVQVSVDGLMKLHDIIRGNGSFDVAIAALEVLKANGIDRRIHFTLHGGGVDKVMTKTLIGMKPIDVTFPSNIGNVISISEMAQSYECSSLCVNYYHPVVVRGLKPVPLKEFVRAQTIANGYFPQPQHCYINGCVGGIVGLSVAADGTYWNCSRSQRIIGKYPQMIGEVIDWDKVRKIEHGLPKRECMRFVREEIRHDR